MATKVIIPFDDKLNTYVRHLYLESLMQPVSYDGGKTVRPRVRHYQNWKKVPPFGRSHWEMSHYGTQLQLLGQNYSPIDATLSKVWVWSDLHFGHKNIIRFSDRPFPDTPTMDEILVENFNNCVKPNDISIWVGDIGFGSVEHTNDLLNRCNGYKILVVGNHDFTKNTLRKLNFNEVHLVYNLTIHECVTVFTHYPMDNMPQGWYNIHGHLHVASKPIKSKYHINVNCEFLEYKPIELTQLAEWIRLREMQEDDGEYQFDYTEYD